MAIAAITLPVAAAAQPLGGYFYGTDAAPSGHEWESPDSLAYNKLQPHAYFFNFDDSETAQRVLPEHSKYVMSLTEKRWRFHWAKQPSERPQDFFRTDFDDSAWAEEWVPMSWNIAGRQKDGTWKYGRPIYSNQRVIFQHSVREGDWRGGVMRKAPADWLVSEFPNEVGSYRRAFTVPAEWKNHEVYINFDGVDSFFYLWINGKYVGFAKNSRSLAEFNITPYLNTKGDNIVAVEVYRNSDGSFLESQDMFRLPGINRAVYLTAKPRVQVSDIVAIPSYEDNHFTHAVLNLSANVENHTKKATDVSIDYALYEVALYGDKTTPVSGLTAKTQKVSVAAGGTYNLNVELHAGDAVKAWTAERPQRYVIVGQLKDKKGNVLQTFSTYTGFRQGYLKETTAADDEFGMAGRYFYLNGKPIKMKGVNRHETSRNNGHAITRSQMENEVMLMKRGNINHVRNSHYPDDPYWYYLCDKYGIMLEDEANIESHEYYYGRESLSHVKEFRNMHVARNMEMVRAHVNHPSILIWSLGNEAGPGQNFKAAYDAIKAFDTSRPVQYERDTKSEIVDFYSNQYPSVAFVKQACEGKVNIKYPMHISEYAHSMGNAVGNLVDYWEAIESSNYCMGGAIWDWVDQAMMTYDPKTGKTYNGYGGDFRDKPNDGTFCMNGLMRPDFSAKPQFYEVKKVYQNVGVRLVDSKTPTLEIFNKNYFTDLSDYNVYWNLVKNGEVVAGGKTCDVDDDYSSYTLGKYYTERVGVINNGRHLLTQTLQPLEGADKIGPRARQQFRLPINTAELDPTAEYFIEVQFCLKKGMPWAQAAYAQMEEQLPLQLGTAPKAQPATATDKPQLTADDKAITVSGNGFEATFCKASGSLVGLQYGGTQMIAENGGLRLDAFRAPTDNDNWARNEWIAAGLDRLKHHATACETKQLSDGSIVLRFAVESKADHATRLQYINRDRNPEDSYSVLEDPSQPNSFQFSSNLVYTIFPDGAIDVQSAITPSKASLELPRIGYTLTMPTSFTHYKYYGRGPINNYADRKTGQFVEVYEHRIGRLGYDIPLPRPQAMGNREEVRWCELTNVNEVGLAFTPTANSALAADAPLTMSASALPWSQQELMGAAHPFQLPETSGTVLHLDAQVTGLGGNSCGQGGPFRSDRVRGSYSFGFTIRPAATKADYRTTYNAVEQPVLAAQDRLGNVTLSTPAQGATILYSLNGAPEKQYTEPFNFREGGELKVRTKESKTGFAYSYHFAEIPKTVPLEVIYTSSFEPGEGEAAHLTDGNEATIWHTQYGVTLAKFPHWVDFDAAATQTIKGFVYTPRKDSPNGYVKDYEIYVSDDAQNWKKVHAASFKREGQPHKVLFAQPVRARYIRFYALNEQGGAEYASGAEFGIIVE